MENIYLSQKHENDGGFLGKAGIAPFLCLYNVNYQIIWGFLTTFLVQLLAVFFSLLQPAQLFVSGFTLKAA